MFGTTIALSFNQTDPETLWEVFDMQNRIFTIIAFLDNQTHLTLSNSVLTDDTMVINRRWAVRRSFLCDEKSRQGVHRMELLEFDFESDSAA